MAEGENPSEVIRDHRRQWRDCLYVYPVVSRRSKGLSIGVNLNHDKSCTFSCVYCQVSRQGRRRLGQIRLEILEDELHLALKEAVSGRLWQERRFAATVAAMRRINDIAFSGDGEPTCLADFDRAVEVAARVKRDLGLSEVKLVLITNASLLGSPQVQRALAILDANNGEIWAKLDAGTEEYFQALNRPRGDLTLGRIVENIATIARGRPIIIQTLFPRWNGSPPPPREVSAYCGRLQEILQAGGKIKLIQIHTIARPPASASVAALPNDELDAIAASVRAAVPAVPVESYHGQDVPPQGRG